MLLLAIVQSVLDICLYCFNLLRYHRQSDPNRALRPYSAPTAYRQPRPTISTIKRKQTRNQVLKGAVCEIVSFALVAALLGIYYVRSIAHDGSAESAYDGIKVWSILHEQPTTDAITYASIRVTLKASNIIMNHQSLQTNFRRHSVDHNFLGALYA